MHGSALSALLACALASAPARADDKPRLLVLDFRAEEPERALAKALAQEAVVVLGERAQFEVLSFSELRKQIELEGEKDLAGCDSTTCAAEIAGALDAEFVVFGDVSKLSKLYVVGVQLYDARNRRLVAREVVRGATEAEVIERTHAAVDRLIPQQGVSPVLVLGAVTAGAGALVGAGGAVMLVLASQTLSDPNAAGTAKDTALTVIPAGIALSVAGGLAVVIGAGVAVGSLVLE